MARTKAFAASLKGASRKLLSRAAVAINKATEARIDDLRANSPVDTGEYIKSHSTTPATIIGNAVVGSNINNAEDAYGVEFGFRSSRVDWHKKQFEGQSYAQRPIIYNGVGANVYQRTSMDRSVIQKVLGIYRRVLGG